ncbi:bifunctional L-myo-inositol-1-phosphate cytidylyltransferase/CDP-L-myo-inositol myo-inositolphosphotransferase [Thermosulfurimonas sp. F29]|uniref:bifunctional L-myo-inositol-1-phosphate cytidylyltransferase/CDP-L-myo-inositol myo-inositolphosphotransferase n=1 Tax=Thermosulfurimonas sp. F29 TaxID=2867247 RepID=UPI001C82D003|nr:bifunctional L-myo-inositol-1-phosphate cytidylyltransferase/CDP-L-myo-inositol myo-inositolphosphotransferase [Thermosulfurimonas sp. F29]MBX6422580.1 NTP transferase domain-containing protein [Thermosulfurimonas sp. F29]
MLMCLVYHGKEVGAVQAVILAAGLGSRMGLARTGYPKGLLRVAGRELLLRHLILLSHRGIREFVLVVNPRNRRLFEEFLSRHPDYRVVLVDNPHPERGNGYSLWCAREAVRGPFVLTMSDHLYEEDFVERALAGRGLIMDRQGRYIDPEEATKVRVAAGRVREIGKDLSDYHGFDTGFFVLDPEIFAVAGEVVRRNPGEVTLSEIVREAELTVTEVSGLFWTDVDTPEDLGRAGRALVRASVKGAGDGWISRLLNRRLSTAISPYLCERLSPNQATVLSFFLGLLAALLAWFNASLGAVLYQIHSVLDGVDGEIARAALKRSRFGGLLDSVLDRYVDFVFLSVLLLRLRPEGFELAVALLALLGTVMVSYVTERFKGAYGRDAYAVFPVLHYFPGKRDERIFLIFFFCVMGWTRELFPVLALLTQGKIAFTLAVFWHGRTGLEAENQGQPALKG